MTTIKRRNSGNTNLPTDIERDDYVPLELLVFDLSSSIVSYGNMKTQNKIHSIRSKVPSRTRKHFKTYPY